MLYAYSTPEVARHQGWCKIGYTEQEVEVRIRQQTHTADVSWALEWKRNAIYEDGSGDLFTDKDFHAYLRRQGVEQEKGKNNEWFHIDGPTSKRMIDEFRENRGIAIEETVIPYTLREEQESAVAQTVAYRIGHEGGEFLWNAKPRFGKTLSVYDFIRRIGAAKVLIVTNRPAIANSWLSDYRRFLGVESGYWFVSEVEALKGKPGVVSREEYKRLIDRSTSRYCIEFVSLQDLKGSKYFGGYYDKLYEVKELTWDVLVIDEAHEGVDTYKTNLAFSQIKRKFTLHLSGTPFKALANEKFAPSAIYNWTYADEQKRKEEWDNSAPTENPYAVMPRLNLYTYRMSEVIREELKQGIEIEGKTEEYAFDLNEFFATVNGRFKYESSVDLFLDALTRQKKYPFSTPELRAELQHTFWLLERVESAKALAKKLQVHPVFQEYAIILAVGDGRLEEEAIAEKNFDKVRRAIAEHEKTITLSVGQLTTGITVPEWSAVLMLSNVKSPSLYMQAAFRAQNPCLFVKGTSQWRKKNAYIFDFDPARTLTIFEQFANDLYSDTASGSGDSEARKKNIRKLLNFFPVIGEDEDGELVELDAERVLSVPRRIRSIEVVRRGFMSNFLFQNIGCIFSAPPEVIDIINTFTPAKEKVPATSDKDLYLDENGEVNVPDEVVKEATENVLGDKIYEIQHDVDAATDDYVETHNPDSHEAIERLKGAVKHIVDKTLDVAQSTCGKDFTRSERKRLERKLKTQSDILITQTHDHLRLQKLEIERERHEALKNREETGKSVQEIENHYDEKSENLQNLFNDELSAAIRSFVSEASETVVRAVETGKREKDKQSIEEAVRDHLRGFARTIPSFLMAYGDENVTLETFDCVIPDAVFTEVTSISLNQFRFLRDGGDYTDTRTGEVKRFDGQLFDSIVFNDSVKEFMSLKQRLADYFDEKNHEDIFDYIPSQKTNQIFTPKKMVKRMVDMLEAESPGCFDSPERSFIDLYMKSGLYITEIVKRLYRSPRMKELYPDDRARLRHIFAHQVYGLAPTEIIYNIAMSYILGFEENIGIEHHNFKQVDALPYAKAGTLNQLLDSLFDDR